MGLPIEKTIALDVETEPFDEKNGKSLGKFSELKRMERQAGNSIIQGSVADIIKLAMRNVDSVLPDSVILLQIHDELVVEVPESAAEERAKKIKELMETCLDLITVKMKVEPKVCRYWSK